MAILLAMEYFTTPEQESRLQQIHQQRLEQEQDRLRASRSRFLSTPSPSPPLPPDRLFFVEPDGTVYLGEVKPEQTCPSSFVAGGGYYGVDSAFLEKVQSFIARHSRYVILFQMRKGYSTRAGIYPARILCHTEELVLEEYNHS